MVGKRIVVDKQWDILLDFMEANLDVAKGSTMNDVQTRGRMLTAWRELSATLNCVTHGCRKSLKEWRDYWANVKCALRKKIVVLKLRESAKLGLDNKPPPFRQWTTRDEKIRAILESANDLQPAFRVNYESSTASNDQHPSTVDDPLRHSSQETLDQVPREIDQLPPQTIVSSVPVNVVWLSPTAHVTRTSAMMATNASPAPSSYKQFQMFDSNLPTGKRKAILLNDSDELETKCLILDGDCKYKTENCSDDKIDDERDHKQVGSSFQDKRTQTDDFNYNTKILDSCVSCGQDVGSQATFNDERKNLKAANHFFGLFVAQELDNISPIRRRQVMFEIIRLIEHRSVM